MPRLMRFADLLAGERRAGALACSAEHSGMLAEGIAISAAPRSIDQAFAEIYRLPARGAPRSRRP